MLCVGTKHCRLKCCLWQVALKFEHRSSKGCNYGPPYEWQVYKWVKCLDPKSYDCIVNFLMFFLPVCKFFCDQLLRLVFCFVFSCLFLMTHVVSFRCACLFAAHLVAAMGCPVLILKVGKVTTMLW